MFRFIFGLIIGGFVGMLAMSLCVISRDVINRTMGKKDRKTLDFAINCGAMGKGDDSCCGCIYWSADGKLLCNECGTEYYLTEKQHVDYE